MSQAGVMGTAWEAASKGALVSAAYGTPEGVP